MNRYLKHRQKKKRLKMLISPDQNGERARQGVGSYPYVDAGSSVYRRLLTRSDSYGESYNSVWKGTVKSREGTSPSPAHRTVRETLASYGSYDST